MTLRRSLVSSLLAALASLTLSATAQTATVAANWVQQAPALSPSTRSRPNSAYDAATGYVVLYGGDNGQADTWTWNGNAWTQQTPVTSPSYRAYTASAYSAGNGTFVLFGGFYQSFLADTWTYDGSTWTRQSPATSPMARDYTTMATNPTNGSVVLFGGFNAGALGDTWIWNGSTWTQQSPATSPPARYRATMAYDAANGTVVLFGGRSASNASLGDTWTWNGTTWTQQSPATSPPARYDSTLSYYGAAGSLVLFGGSGNGVLGDTWTWNGTTWKQQFTSVNPPARYGSTMSSSVPTNTTVLFGGSDAQGLPLNDTWTYGAGAFTAPNTAVGTAAPQTAVTFTIGTAGTLPALTNANVLTQGAPGLDFTLGTGSTCTGTVTAGQTCTVNVAFKPTVPGQRIGAVQLTNGSGSVIVTAFISSIGTGPLRTLSPGTISTVAGNGTAGYVAAQDGGPAASAELYYPSGTAVDSVGNLYIADYGNNRVRKISAPTGNITTVAGNGIAGYVPAQDGGPAAGAEVSYPNGVAVDGAGNLYIADSYNNRIRKVTASTGIITTVAGNGTGGYIAAQDGGQAISAELNYPYGLTVDGAGNLYIADQGNHRIRKVTASTGIITTVAGNGTHGYVAAQDGGQAINAELNTPYGLTVDGSGNLYIADQGNHRIRKVTASTGIITTVAGNGTGGYVTGQDGGLATSAELQFPSGVAVDGSGDLYIADRNNNRIRKVTASAGVITTVAGNGNPSYSAGQDGGPAGSAGLYLPVGVTVDASGNLYIGDQTNNRIRKILAKAAIAFPTATSAGTVDTNDGTQTATLNNIGNLPLTIASMANTATGSFTLANPMTGGCSTQVAVPVGGSCILGEQFAPALGSSGIVTNSLAITDNSLNITGSVQSVPLLGTTAAGVVNITVGAASVLAGTTYDTLTVTVGYSGTTADIGAVTVTVDGSATGVGTPSCTAKGGHKNCSYPYTGTVLAHAGTYTIAVTVAADSNYSTASGSGTLTVTAPPNPTALKPRPVVISGPIPALPASF